MHQNVVTAVTQYVPGSFKLLAVATKNHLAQCCLIHGSPCFVLARKDNGSSYTKVGTTEA